MPTRSELEAAYRATTYRVFLPGGALDLRIGECCPALEAWLAGSGLVCWAVLTAANPGSRLLSEADNRARQSALEVALLEAGHEPYAAENVPDGDWPVEESCFVAGLAHDEAMALAERFGQNAFVYGESGEAPRLVWGQGA